MSSFERLGPQAEEKGDRDAILAQLANQEKLEASPAILSGRSERIRFDPRTEVSADARYIAGKIVNHLWIIFILLPVGAAVFYAMLTAR